MNDDIQYVNNKCKNENVFTEMMNKENASLVTPVLAEI